MAARRRISEGMRRLRRWTHTTPHALDGVRLGVAAIVGGLALAGFAAFSEVGTRTVTVAALPVASQVVKQVRTSRQRRGDEKRRLSMDTLEGADLTGVELPASYLRNRNLSEARLVQANLVKADLSGAVLAGTRLGGADLSYGQLSDAWCHDTSFYRARLVEIDLRGADARDASFEEADLRHADLRDADLLGARFRGADVRGADFTGAKLAPDALAGATVDGTTVLQSGRAAAPLALPLFEGWRAGLDGGLRRVGWTTMRPVAWGLGVAVAVGAVVATDLPDGGLAGQVSEAFGSDPMTRPRPATGSGAGIDRVGGFGPWPSEAGSDASGISDDGILSPVEPGSDGSGPPEAGEASGELGEAGAPAQRTAVEAWVPAAGTDLDPVPGTDPAPDPGSGPALDTGNRPSTTIAPLTEEPTASVFAPPAVHRVELMLVSEGGPSTVTTTSALGRSDPQVFTGRQGWALNLPSGTLDIELVPGDGTTTTSCRIVVDGIEMSFQAGFAGQLTHCTVDLDPSG